MAKILVMTTLAGVRLHQDAIGRFYFDGCETDLEHTLVPKPEDGDYRRCRTYLDNAKLFGPVVGARGTFHITVHFEPEEG